MIQSKYMAKGEVQEISFMNRKILMQFYILQIEVELEKLIALEVIVRTNN